jgi:transposase
MRIIAQQSRQQKRKLRRLIHKERDAGMKTRLSIILHLAEGQGPAAVARALHVARSTVYRVAERFRDGGLAGLADRREDNGGPLVDDAVLLELRAIVAQRPAYFGWPRPTWTQEMLALTLAATNRRETQPSDHRPLLAGARRPSRPAAPRAAVPVEKSGSNAAYSCAQAAAGNAAEG